MPKSFQSFFGYFSNDVISLRSILHGNLSHKLDNKRLLFGFYAIFCKFMSITLKDLIIKISF